MVKSHLVAPEVNGIGADPFQSPTLALYQVHEFHVSFSDIYRDFFDRSVVAKSRLYFTNKFASYALISTRRVYE